MVAWKCFRREGDGVVVNRRAFNDFDAEFTTVRIVSANRLATGALHPTLHPLWSVFCQRCGRAYRKNGYGSHDCVNPPHTLVTCIVLASNAPGNAEVEDLALFKRWQPPRANVDLQKLPLRCPVQVSGCSRKLSLMNKCSVVLQESADVQQLPEQRTHRPRVVCGRAPLEAPLLRLWNMVSVFHIPQRHGP